MTSPRLAPALYLVKNGMSKSGVMSLYELLKPDEVALPVVRPKAGITEIDVIEDQLTGGISPAAVPAVPSVTLVTRIAWLWNPEQVPLSRHIGIEAAQSTPSSS